ncbi:MAG: glutamate-cysteine ligase family protein [Promethearchaeota archaeon]
MQIPPSRLPFSIGSEIELQIVHENGEMLRGETLIKVWGALFENLKGSFENHLSLLPDWIRKKVGGFRFVTKERQGKHLYYLEIEYNSLGKKFQINIIGPDPNISQITWLMELVLPPCESFEEFASWNAFLNKVLLLSLPAGFYILPIGLNPVEAEYMSGVTYGEHYHVGIKDPKVKLAAYNMLRNFIPHLIALTVNSPFVNKKPTGTVKVLKKDEVMMVLGKDCIKSLRLYYNRGQMGPMDKATYIPALENLDHEKYCSVIRRSPPDDRFTDLYPFTSYGTIEIRIFDTQFSIARRLAIVAVIQALCLKAKNLVDQEVKVPSVKSAVLVANREKAILFGLHGKFTPDELLNKSFGAFYNEDPMTGRTNGKMFQAVNSMFYFLKREIATLGIEELIAPFYQSITGSLEVRKPFTPADYLLYIYERSNSRISTLINELKGFQQEFCSMLNARISDPVIEEWKLPEHPLFYRKSELASGDPRGKGSEGVAGERMMDALSISGISLDFNEANFQQERGLKPPKSFTYDLHFTVDSTVPGIMPPDIVIIQQLIEKQQKKEIVLASSFKKIPVTVGEVLEVDDSKFPLVLDRGLFVGNKQCRVKFTLKLGNREYTTYSNSFWLELIPKLSIRSDFKKVLLHPGDKVDITFKVKPQGQGRTNFSFDGTSVFQVIASTTGAVLYGREKPLSFRTEGTVSFTMHTRDFIGEGSVFTRFFVLMGNTKVGRFESKEIRIQEASKDEMKTSIKVTSGGSFWPREKKAGSPVQGATKPAKPEFVKKLDFSAATSKAPGGAGAAVPAVKSISVTKVSIDGGKKKVQSKKKKGPSIKSSLREIKKTTPNLQLSNKVPATERSSQKKIARLLSKGSQPRKKKAPKIDIPFTTPADRAGFQYDVVASLKTSKILAPGNKTQVYYELKRKKTTAELRYLNFTAFLLNEEGDVMIVSREKQKVTGGDLAYTLAFDPGKSFKYWKPTKQIYLILHVHDEGHALVGQSVVSGLDVAKFTTSSQISWKKIDLITNVVYPSEETSLDLEFEVKSFVQPFILSVKTTCQNMQDEKEIRVEHAGLNRFLVPISIPYQGFTQIQSTPFLIKIFDASGMQIKEAKKVVGVIPKGPLFAIRNFSVDAYDGLENVTVSLDLFNDGKFDVNILVDLLVNLPHRGSYFKLDSKKVSLRIGGSSTVIYSKLKIPLVLITQEILTFMCLIHINNFQKANSLIVREVDRKSIVKNVDSFIVKGYVKNLDHASSIKSGNTKVSLEVEAHWKVRVSRCKLRLIEFMDGKDYRILKTFPLPKDKDSLFEPVYWSPPRVKDNPRFCKIEIRLYQNDVHVTGNGIIFEPIFFTVYP